MVITFLQQDLAAAKAQMLALQADAASAMEHARRVKLEADSQSEQLRKEKYFRYAWSRHQQEPGHPHHFRIVPRRFPHADGADLGTLRVFSQAL